MNQLTESEIRELRNRVYDHVISDVDWSAVRENWMKPGGQAWLLVHDFILATQHGTSMNGSEFYCPDCGAECKIYRREWGRPGDWNYSWEAGLECPACGRVRIPTLTPGQQSEQPET
jgi:predicted RNA-binding Zn-ribbon protein involved in translation (DUF1610 family)